jgi:hypothetical protein
MFRFVASTSIASQPSDVWAYVSDLDTLREWDPGTTEVRWKAPLGVGDTIVVVANLLGPRVAGARITAYEPPRRIGWRYEPRGSRLTWAGFWLEVWYDVDKATDGAAILSRTVECHGGGLLGAVAEPFLGWFAKRERRAEIDNVKRILESRPMDVGPSAGEPKEPGAASPAG